MTFLAHFHQICAGSEPTNFSVVIPGEITTMCGGLQGLVIVSTAAHGQCMCALVVMRGTIIRGGDSCEWLFISNSIIFLYLFIFGTQCMNSI